MSDYQGNIIIKNPATPTGPSAYGSAPGMWKLNEVAYWIKQGVWPNPAITPDIYFPYVSLLLSTTSLGNANNNLFVDSSGAFNPISRNGNTTQGSFTPYATNWSNYFNGGTDRLQVPVTSNMYLGTTYTIEAWAYYNSSSYGARPIFSQTEAFQGGFANLTVGLNTSGQLIAEYRPATSGAITLITGPTVVPNTWFHIALVSNSSSAKLYVNGTQVGATTTFGDYPSAKTTFVAVGSWGHGWNDPGIPAAAWIGYISNMRVVKGTAVYTSNFTPSTTPLTAISGTVLLTCQSNRFIDNSSVNNTLTPVSTVSVQDFSPFSPAYPGAVYNQSDITNWSMYSDGTGDSLTAPVNTAFAFGTGDFTIEFWAYIPVWTNEAQLIGAHTAFVGLDFLLQQWNSGQFRYLDNTLILESGVAPPTNQWNHIAVTRSGTTVRIFINGTQTASGTSAQNIPSTRAVGILGDTSGAQSQVGYISNVRIVKGTAVYTSNFTPPTSPLTAISGTSLLTCQNAAFTDNSTNNFVLTRNGNPTVTGNSPFNTVGYWSNYFDASGDYQRISSSQVALQFGTGDFTIEGWVYSTGATGTYQQILTGGSSWTSGSGGVYWYYNGGSPYIGAAWNQIATNPAVNSGTLATNTWHHFAVVRSGNTLTLYINGSSVDTLDVTGVSMAVNNQSQTNIGGGGWDQDFGGYLSNLRVVKGTAVYTSNFTVPTTPLTAITNTSLLVCQAARFIDSSSNAFTLVPAGNVAVQSFDPFYTATIASNGGSMYFDGNADYVSIPNGPSMVLSGGTYTLEAWVYPTGDRSAYRTIFVKRAGDPTPCAWQVSLSVSTGNLIFYNGTLYNSGVAVPLNAWSHVAAVYDGTNINLYLNGSRVLQSATSNVDCNANAQIGYFFSSVQEPFIGYIANARILKGVQAYTGASYTVPTAPANPTAATVLMVNGMNAGIYDATTINNLETVGNAQVSTSVSKFGGSSMYFDGSGDTLTAPPNPAFAFGTGQFTVEMWMYWNAVTNIGEFACFTTTGSGGCFTFYYSGGTLQAVATGGAGVTSGSWTPSTGQWYHVAATRDASNVQRIFINGTLLASSTSTNNYGQNGFTMSYNNSFNGYIDDLRVTRGVARYTANFTPPTQPFPIY